MTSLAGTVVLYNPENKNIENIRTYIDYLEVLFVIDNSENIEEEIINVLRKNAKVHYVLNQNEGGLAKALNLGAALAIEKGYNWLLTMDQDSIVSKEMIPNMFEYIERNETRDVAVISPFQTDLNQQESPSPEPYEDVLTVMTSGNLLNLELFQSNGPFLEKLFIDSIDQEYCLRARRNGYRVIKINNAILLHNLGNQKVYPSGFISTHHNPSRRYFITRNRFFVARVYRKQFPEFYRETFIITIKDIAKILLVEKQKLKKIYNMAMGYIDSFKL